MCVQEAKEVPLGSSEPISGTDFVRIKLICKVLSSVPVTAMPSVAVLVTVVMCTNTVGLMITTYGLAQRVV